MSCHYCDQARDELQRSRRLCGRLQLQLAAAKAEVRALREGQQSDSLLRGRDRETAARRARTDRRGRAALRLLAEGLTVAQIAEREGVGRGAVWRWLRAAGWKSGNAQPEVAERRKIAATMAAAGARTREVAARLSCGEVSAQRLIRAGGFVPNGCGTWRKA